MLSSVTDEEKLVKHVVKPSFKSRKIFTSNLVAVHSIKERLLLNRSSYFGMCILDNSNCLMYHFHYNVIKKKKKAALLFTDTDPHWYEIKSKNVYERFWKHKRYFYNSENQNEKFGDPTNKKVIGKFKDDGARRSNP